MTEPVVSPCCISNDFFGKFFRQLSLRAKGSHSFARSRVMAAGRSWLRPRGTGGKPWRGAGRPCHDRLEPPAPSRRRHCVMDNAVEFLQTTTVPQPSSSSLRALSITSVRSGSTISQSSNSITRSRSSCPGEDRSSNSFFARMRTVTIALGTGRCLEPKPVPPRSPRP